jgi:hypothetical protein
MIAACLNLSQVSSRANSVITNNSFTALTAAIAAGGTVVLQFDGTVSFDSTINVVSNTVLDATGRQVTLNGRNATRLFTVGNEAQLALNSLSLTGGSNYLGGAVYVDGATLVASNCVFSRNTAAGTNGVRGIDQATVAGAGLDGGTGENGQDGQGGAIYNGGVAKLYQCQFLTNKAAGGAGGAGGNAGNGSFRGGNGGHGGNGAAGQGGAIYNLATLWLSNCTFYANATQGGIGAEGGTNGTNTATNGIPIVPRYLGGGGIGGVAAGGAVFNRGSLFVANSTFATNGATAGKAASHGGWINNGTVAEKGPDGGTAYGGAIENEGYAGLFQCTFWTNYVQGTNGGNGGKGNLGGAKGGNGGHGYGGSLDNAGSLAATNCTIAGGFAGGGLPGTNSITNTLFSTTGAPGESRGANLSRRSGTLMLVNTIVADPKSGANAFGAVTDIGHNLCSDKSCEFSDFSSHNSVNPYLGPLTNNGGLTATMALLPGSPALDTALSLKNLVADQRGQSRPSGPGFDIGAFEKSAYLAQGKVISGSVGIPNLKITLTSINATRTTTTDGTGNFTFSNLAPGSYDLTPDPAGVGYYPPTITVLITQLGANAVSLNFAANPSQILDLTSEGNHWTISGLGVPRFFYTAEMSPDLILWTPTATNLASDTGSLSFTNLDSGSEPQRFYRLRQK